MSPQQRLENLVLSDSLQQTCYLLRRLALAPISPRKSASIAASTHDIGRVTLLKTRSKGTIIPYFRAAELCYTNHC